MDELVRVRYENTLEDLIAFNEFHLSASPHLQRSIRWITWAPPVGVLCVAVALAVLKGSTEWVVWGAVFAVLYVLIYRRLVKRQMSRTIQALLREGRNDAVLCEHVLEITPDGLQERTPVSKSRTAWSAIKRVESVGDYTFIYTQAHAAHVVPRDRLIEGDYERFKETLGSHVRG